MITDAKKQLNSHGAGVSGDGGGGGEPNGVDRRVSEGPDGTLRQRQPLVAASKSAMVSHTSARRRGRRGRTALSRKVWQAHSPATLRLIRPVSYTLLLLRSFLVVIYRTIIVSLSASHEHYCRRFVVVCTCRCSGHP
jgi:hypothetical protein